MMSNSKEKRSLSPNSAAIRGISALLACVVLFFTFHALTRPAITLEGQVCPLQEHVHTEACYETPEAPSDAPAHTHTDECYAAARGELTCELEEGDEHQHTDECYATVRGELTCGLEETAPAEPKLICELEEHTHSEACQGAPALSEEDQARVNEAIALIDALPTAEEAEAQLTALEDAGDDAGYEIYYQSLYQQVWEAYLLYEDLGAELQVQVTNSDKLLAFSFMLTTQPLATTDTLTIQQVNRFGSASGGTNLVILIYNNSSSAKAVGDIVTNLYQFPGASSITVENRNGTLRISEVDNGTGSNKKSKSVPAYGFVVVIPDGRYISATVGDTVTANFDYTTAAYNTNGLGTLAFTSSASYEPKPEKDNSSKLTKVQSADTNGLIEVNLYDYGTNINDMYNNNPFTDTNHKADGTTQQVTSSRYPGFQQEYGSWDVGETLNKWASFNFGNNITSDLAAGKNGVTVRGGTTINATTIDDTANRPISGMMATTLGADGYPRLATGESLAYLFSDNTYATKMNTQVINGTTSINGLFKYDPVTGAYSFNSRENHAQFDAATNTFTLYKQILTPNFMMYPFGNFLPFNDIVHDSAQTSTIDRAYLQTIAGSALYKYNASGVGTEYQTLGTQLNKFVGLMDTACGGTGWAAADAMNKYFALSGIPKTFSQNEPHLQNLYSLDYDVATDFYFGMDMKMRFIQPKDGLTGKDTNVDGTPDYKMVFDFSGDDDVWVYVDGVLFLDLSGIHRHVGGRIDFETGKVHYCNLDPATGDISQTQYKTVLFSELVDKSLLNEKGTFKDYSTHTFNFYYMERGSGSGVCRMNFNFPFLRENSISVTKELSVDGANIDLLGNPDFRFQIFKENGTDLLIGPGVTYDILDSSGTKIGEGTTDANGIFKLKATQTAVFDKITENSGNYFVQELLSPDAFTQYGKFHVDGKQSTESYGVTTDEGEFTGIRSPLKDMADGSTSFTFDNNVDPNKLGSLSITKTMTGETLPASGKFDFEVTLDGDPLPVGTKYTVGSETRTVTVAGIVSLAKGETAVISNILAGSVYAVKETEASAAGYTVTYTVDGVRVDSATGYIRTSTHATTAVVCDNSEYAASVQIPIQKTLLMPDGLEHTYRLKLEQVTDQQGQTPADPAVTQELPILITETPVKDAFTIHYTKTSLDALQTFPQTCYYKITELTSEDEADTLFDTTVYVAEVTITNENGAYTAALTGIWKDGAAVTGTEDAPAIAFTNTIQRYALPNTGGRGTALLYATGGLLLITVAFLLLYSQRRRRKEDPGSS